jgi:hypothetical protein
VSWTRLDEGWLGISHTPRQRHCNRRGENFFCQIPLGPVAFHRVMAADEIERADEAAIYRGDRSSGL